MVTHGKSPNSFAIQSSATVIIFALSRIFSAEAFLAAGFTFNFIVMLFVTVFSGLGRLSENLGEQGARTAKNKNRIISDDKKAIQDAASSSSLDGSIQGLTPILKQ